MNEISTDLIKVRSWSDNSACTNQLIYKLVESFKSHTLSIITHTLGHFFLQNAVGEYALWGKRQGRGGVDKEY